MPKKKRQESQAEQSARFKRDAQRLIDAGELDPVEGAAAVDALMKQAKHRPNDRRSS